MGSGFFRVERPRMFDPRDPRDPRNRGGQAPQPGQAAPAYHLGPQQGGAPPGAAPGMPQGPSPWQPPGPPQGATGQGAPINWGALAQQFGVGQQQGQQPQAPMGGPPRPTPWQPQGQPQGQLPPWMQGGGLQQLAQRLAQRRQQAGAPQGGPAPMDPRRNPVR
jgi:hypothetical protein